MEVRLHPLEFARHHLPFVCASSGVPAAWYQRVGIRRSMHPAAFLLIFIGPLGWLILVAMVFRLERTYLEIPISQAVYEQIQERRQRVRWLSAVIVIGTALALYLGSNGPFSAPWLAMVVVLAGGMGFWAGSVKNPQFRVSIDGVGLVTISRCHPNFVAAVELWRRSDSEATTRL